MGFDLRAIIGIAIGVAVVVAVIPTALANWNDSDTTANMTAGEAALWGVGGIIIVAAIIFGVAGPLIKGNGNGM